MGRLSLGDLLSFFPSNDLAKALTRAGLHGGGTKIERVELLLSADRLLVVIVGPEELRRHPIITLGEYTRLQNYGVRG